MIRCPHCDKKIFTPVSTCPHCNEPISFTIESFLKENFHLFTIIGVIGTMISLLPNIGTQIMGITWITDIDSTFPLFLSITMLFGTILISIIFIILLIKVSNSYKFGEKSKINILNKKILYHKWEWQRSFIFFCLLGMGIGFVAFVIPAILQIRNLNVYFFIIVILMVASIILPFIIGIKLAKVTDEITKDSPKLKKAIITVSLILLIVVLLLFFFPSQSMDHNKLNSENIYIDFDQTYFSPEISSDKAIKFEITNLSGQESYKYFKIWHTDYGFFISYNPSTGETKILGNETCLIGNYIFWTFSDHDKGIEKPPVKIEMKLINSEDNSVITKKSLNISWFDKDIAQINP